MSLRDLYKMTLDVTVAETSLKISVADNNGGEGRDISNIQNDQGQLISQTRYFLLKRPSLTVACFARDILNFVQRRGSVANSGASAPYLSPKIVPKRI